MLLLFIFACVDFIVFIVVIQVIRKNDFMKRGRDDQTPFEYIYPSANLKILFLGDSTAVGTGAQSNTESTAGWFAQDFPKAHIVNFSLNGRKLKGLLRDFYPDGNRYHVVVVQIGANDILWFTPFSKIRKEITEVIERVKTLADTIVILHSGNLGLSPIFIWPFNQIMTWRSRVVREIYIQTARAKGVLYVDLFTERHNDLFLKDVEKYYCPDCLHPSGAGYRWWYERIRQTLSAAGIKLTD